MEVASPYDRAQLPRELRPGQTEVNWIAFEAGDVAGLVWLSRTGPRLNAVELAFGLLPVGVVTDDRPLLMVALYDLAKRTPPVVIEREVEHDQLDLATFSAVTADGALELRPSSIRARVPELELELQLRPRKPMVTFGPHGAELRHGRFVTHYAQRPRIDVTGFVRRRGGEAVAVRGDAVQDRQWFEVTRPNLKWIWPNLRLDDGRELTGYVMRDSTRGRYADADDGEEIGRVGFVIDPAGAVTPTRFDVRALAHVETDRGRVPVRFAVAFPDLRIETELVHVVPAPFVRMRAFGDALDAGIYEGPIEHVEVAGTRARGWIEVMNAAMVRIR